MISQLQLLGFYLAGFVCVVLAILKLTIEGHWSWWRVLLPLWVVFGHNAVYIAVGFAWFRFADDGEATITAKTMARPLINWQRCCVFSSSPITCSDESREPRRLRGWD